MEIRRQVWNFMNYRTLLCGLFMLSLGFSTFAQDKTAGELYNEGLALLKAKDYVAALPLMEQALKLGQEANDEQVIKLCKKNGAVAAYRLGSTKRKAKDYEGAVAAYNKGIEINQGYYANYLGRAQVWSKQGDKVAAVKGYIEAAQVAGKAGKAEKEAEIYGKAENLVAVLYSKKKWDETLSASEALLAAYESADAHFYRAYAFNKKSKAADAKTHLDKAFDLAAEMSEEDKAKYYMLKAGILEKAGKTDEAITVYKKVTGDKYLENAKYKIQALSSGSN